MDEPRTARICEACGGTSTDCIWCVNGLQTIDQRRHWREFRSQMRQMSDMQSLIREIVGDTILQLTRRGTPKCLELVTEGKCLLHHWLSAETEEEVPGELDGLVDFHQRAVEELAK